VRARARALAAAARPAGDHVELVSPSPGLFRLAVRPGDLVQPGGVLGELEILGRLVAVIAPEGVRGAVIAVAGDGLARPAIEFGAVLATIDPGGVACAPAIDPGGAAPAAAPGASGATGRVFRAPTSGRFYGRPGPDRPPFVAAGDALAPGATICLLEVMKTFHRVTYAGEPARVREVLVADGADVSAGDPLLALE
jgi:acetyl-CoA carboxylase biotin carboxyl carrier protein